MIAAVVTERGLERRMIVAAAAAVIARRSWPGSCSDFARCCSDHSAIIATDEVRTNLQVWSLHLEGCQLWESHLHSYWHSHYLTAMTMPIITGHSGSPDHTSTTNLKRQLHSSSTLEALVGASASLPTVPIAQSQLIAVPVTGAVD